MGGRKKKKKKKKAWAVELSNRACSVDRAGFLVSSSGETFFAPPLPALERGGGGHSNISTAISGADAWHSGARRALAQPGVHLRVPGKLGLPLLLPHTHTYTILHTRIHTISQKGKEGKIRPVLKTPPGSGRPLALPGSAPAPGDRGL